MSDKLKAVVVGCGRIGCGFDDTPGKYIRTHAKAYEAIPQTELVGLSDAKKGPLEIYSAKYDVKGYQSYKALLENVKPDIVSLCTPNKTHCEIIKYLISHDVKAIFCEKPFTSSLAEADESIRVCKKNNVVLAVDHQRRFDSIHRQIADFLSTGRLGPIQCVVCYYGGGVANTGSHLFDLLRLYFGEVAWIQAKYSKLKSHNRVDPNLDIQMEFKNGISANILTCDMRAFAVFDIEILGGLGKLKIRSIGFEVEIEYEGTQNSVHFEGGRELNKLEFPLEDSSRELLVLGIKNIIQCLETAQTPMSTGEDGRAALEIITGARESIMCGGEKIYFPLNFGNAVVLSE